MVHSPSARSALQSSGVMVFSPCTFYAVSPTSFEPLSETSGRLSRSQSFAANTGQGKDGH